MGLNICGTISKVILVLMNVAYIVIGLGFVIVGILFLAQQTKVELVTGNDTLAVGLVLIGAGVFICLVAILGIVAAVGEFFSLLTVYLFAMLVLVVLQIAGTVLCMYNKDNIRRNAENKFKQYISKYKDATSDEYNAEINDIVDALQHTLHCCGLKTPYDWATENADISANSTERHVSRIQSMAYTPLESYPTNTVTNEYGPNDVVVDHDNESMYIK